MATIRKKVRLLILVMGLGATVSICLFIISVSKLYFKEYTWPLLYFSMPVTLISTIVLIQEYKKLRMAKVIIENQILHIMSAYFLITDSGERAQSLPDRIEIFVSNFGIILDSKIVKFNQGGEQLKAVEIGRDYISLTYGTCKQTQTIRLLHAEIDSAELKKITERFRFETGIIPKIVK